jgi:transcriptional regulator GlxA family with amidase domain
LLHDENPTIWDITFSLRECSNTLNVEERDVDFMKGRQSMARKRVAILGFEGAMALDIVGPYDAFSVAATSTEISQPQTCYEVVVAGITKDCFAAESGMIFKPHVTMRNALPVDTVIVPGGVGLRVPKTQNAVAAWIKSVAPKVRRIATVCTGIYGVAPTGLLDGQKVTTHWKHAEDLALKFPRLRVDASALYRNEGKMYTCGGITAGIDLSLALIEEDYGPSVALAVARELVVYLKRSGGQEQFSEPLRYQSQAKNAFADLAAWIQGHLNEDLGVEQLARRVHLSPRHFSREFRQAFGMSPAKFVSEARLNEARARLVSPRQTVEAVADSLGFSSADGFHRAFERRFGVAPSRYKIQFSSGTKRN